MDPQASTHACSPGGSSSAAPAPASASPRWRTLLGDDLLAQARGTGAMPAACRACRTSRPRPSASSICSSPAVRRRWTCSTTSRRWQKCSGTELPDSIRKGQRLTGMTAAQASFPDRAVASSSSRSTASRARGSASCCRTPRRSSTSSASSSRCTPSDQSRPGGHVLPDRLPARRPAEHRRVGQPTAWAARTRTCRRSW